jgi:hypothetical protein
MSIDILQAIIQRRNYPVLGNSIASEVRYASEVLNTDNDSVLLVFPSAVLNRTRTQIAQLREAIFPKWKVTGIFDVDGIFAPETSIPFSILFLHRTDLPKVRFGTFTGRAFGTSPQKRRRDGTLGELPPISKDYRNYLASIGELINSNVLPPSQKEFRFYEIEVTQFDDSQLNTRFYDPGLTENEEKIRREKWVRLGVVAKVLLPQPNDQPSRLLTPKNFEYPFPEHLPTRDSGTDIVLQRGDIVVSSTDITQAFLVTVTPDSDIRPSRLMYVIRPHSDIVSPHYLFLYLKSDTARKYAMRYEQGIIFQRINRQTLLDFPIVVPSQITQRQSLQLFERLYLRKDDASISERNKFLFTPQRLPRKIIQKEFVLEHFGNYQQDSRRKLNGLLMTDFDEVEKCLEVHVYKACLTLCGSILEVVLLDWLTEIEGKDYFGPKNNITLDAMIKKLERHLGYAYSKARNIKNKRNLVHPNVLLNSSTEINNEVCQAVICDLEDVFRQRGLDTKTT